MPQSSKVGYNKILSGGSNSVNGNNRITTSEDRFKAAHEQFQESVKKHIEAEYESSEEEDELETQPILDSTLEKYSRLGGKIEDLEKIQNCLQNLFQSGAAVCLICIATVKRIDKIWNCQSCYGFFHLYCIQRWAKDSIAHLKLQFNERPDKQVVFKWQCPKCRLDYNQNEIPYNYTCFCGNTEDPDFHPWMVPHSCGNTCSRSLQPHCGHTCLLLCHPGPCPPCPKMVTSRCYCGRSPSQKTRCCHKERSCGQTCGKKLPCLKHVCRAPCHAQLCPPCPETSSLPCLCRRHSKIIPCSQLNWQCDQVCGEMFSCELHNCQKRCHEPGQCGPCPGSQPRNCPCGKTTVLLPCQQEVMPCGSTCEKLLDCGLHTCSERCHKGPCASCLAVVEKACRCGLSKKEIACQKEYLCENKCKKVKDCGVHMCKRKCCDGQCLPCEKPCAKTLPCGQHKCASVCHRGPCLPCTVTKTLYCRCAVTSIVLPCSNRKKHPPKCKQRCRIPPDCDHPVREAHNCHFGPCPLCRQVCRKPQPCGHPCPSACHTTPNHILNPSTNSRVKAVRETLEVAACPPCMVQVGVVCLGDHESLSLPCHSASPRSCGRPCGQLLSCTNHLCDMECHDTKLNKCEDCNEDCSAERMCNHPCLFACHPAPCPPCVASVKLTCHCRLSTVLVKCSEWVGADDHTKDKLLCCGVNCPKQYECGHKCNRICHAGECPGLSNCKRKVKLTCPCKLIKKEFVCFSVFGKKDVVQCTESCKEAKIQSALKKEKALLAEKLAQEEKEKAEFEEYEKRKKIGRRRQRRKTSQTPVEDNMFKTVLLPFMMKNQLALVISTIVLVFGVSFYAFNN